MSRKLAAEMLKTINVKSVHLVMNCVKVKIR